MIQRINKYIMLLLIVLMISTTSFSAFAQGNMVLSEDRNESTDELKLSNSKDLGVEDINEKIKEIYPYGEIVAIKETEFGTAYYVDSQYHQKRKKRSLWDALDVVMAGASWADFFKDPSLKNLGWATLDTAALLPLLPSTAYFRKGGKLVLKTSEVKKLAKTSKGKAAIKKALKGARHGACFVKGTKVLTNEGYKNIEDIKVNDLVYSKDITNNVEDLKHVKNIFFKKTNTIVTIKTKNEEINTTLEHPFFIKDKGFKSAKEIRKGDKIVKFSNLYCEVSDIKISTYPNSIDVYNFEVEDWHNYFVGYENLLVHNTCQVKQSSAIKRAVKKLSHEAKKGYEKAIEALKKGDLRGLNDHSLSNKWKGHRAVDIKGMGKGRGKGRIIYKKLKDGSIEIVEILTNHNY